MRTDRSPILAAVAFGLALAAGLVGGCDKQEQPEPQAAAEPAPPFPPGPLNLDAEPVAPLPTELDVDMKKVALGRRLYHDARLSGDGTVSCATCHSLDHGGAEPRRTSFGIRGQVGPINSPTVLNARFNVAQFWNGRAKDLAEQAGGPVENPVEMGSDFDQVCDTLSAIESYRTEFEAIYGAQGITRETITDAIAEYEKSLVTPSPFDAYLRGELDAISAEAKEGYQVFKATGCTTCHNGVGIGGGIFQKMGLVHDYFAQRGGELTEADLGRYAVTQNEADKHMFKVPTLRNVALTAPYYHDGSQETLEDAVRTMAHVQLGRELGDDEVAKIVAFLNTLTGELPEFARLQEGELPEDCLAPEPPRPAAADEGAEAGDAPSEG